MDKPKVTMRTSGEYQEVYVGDKRIIGDDGINTDSLLYYLARALGFEYERIDGKWDARGDWHPAKRRTT